MENKIFIIEEDIQVMYLQADNFPSGVLHCYEQLEKSIAKVQNRRYFGISWPDQNGNIMYKAAAEIQKNEIPDQYGLDSFTIKKGNYISIYIKDHMSDGKNIPQAFAELLQNPNIDKEGYCLEIYSDFTDADVHCMVPLIC